GVAGPGPQPRPGPLRRRDPADHAGLGRGGRSRGGDGGLAVTPGVARGRRGADHRQPWLSTSHLTPAVCCTPTHSVLEQPPAGYGIVTSKGLGGHWTAPGVRVCMRAGVDLIHLISRASRVTPEPHRRSERIDAN